MYCFASFSAFFPSKFCQILQKHGKKGDFDQHLVVEHQALFEIYNKQSKIKRPDCKRGEKPEQFEK